MDEISLSQLLGCVINAIAAIYVWHVIADVKADFKDKKLYISVIMIIGLAIFSFLYISPYLRFFTVTMLLVYVHFYLYQKDLSNSILSVFLEQLIMLMSEVIAMIFISIIGKITADYFWESIIVTLLINIIISGLAISLINIPFLKTIIRKIVIVKNGFIIDKNITLLVFMLLTLNILLTSTYSELNLFVLLCINTGFMVTYSFIMATALKEKVKTEKIQEENKLLLNNLSDYEKMLDHQRVANHENKNQLLVIKTMIKEPEAIDYINEIVKEKRSDNEILLTRAKKIPEGGIQGIIYQKMLLMSENKIRAELEVSRNLKELDFHKLTSDLTYDVCRILGVFLDNAIQEVNGISRKEIFVNLYADKNSLVIEISNPFDPKKIIDLDKIDDKGYTTKGDGHGYGLSLVKDIINNSKKITNERHVGKEMFKQIIKIKM